MAHIVLVNAGDLARSPRASLHAHSLVRAKFAVTVIGYGDNASALHPMWPENVRYQLIKELPSKMDALAKHSHLKSALKAKLAEIQDVHVVLLMAPPSVPTAGILRKWASAQGARLVIDWHNLGALRMAYRSSHWALATIYYRWREQQAARWPEVKHLAVSPALADYLGNGAAVLWDCPTKRPSNYRGDKQAFLREHGDELPELDLDAKWLVVPSSWSDEERPDLLLYALEDRRSNVPIEVIFTGRGPELAAFQQRAARLSNLHFLWLKWPTYQQLLRCADIGICCHESYYALDFPFKRAEFVSAGLTAWIYCGCENMPEPPSTLPGDQYFAADTSDLSRLLNFEHDAPTGAPRLNAGTWDEHWQSVALPLLSGQ